MGEYCTVRDVRLALAPDGEWENKETAASLQDHQIEDAINEAEGIVNGHVLRRYEVTPMGIVNGHVLRRYEVTPIEIEMPNPDNPSETWVFFVAPDPLRAWTRDIAAYLATLTFRKHKDLEERDPIQLRFDIIKAYLIAVRDGGMHLNLPTPTVEEGTGPTAYNRYEGELFPDEPFELTYGGSRNPQVLWPHDRIDV